MTARLPIPGSDDGTWGNLLNTYLTVEHNADGTLKLRTDGTLRLANLSDVSGSSGATNGQVLTYNSTSNQWVPGTISSTTVSDATTTSKGIVQLAGDLTGTAASPAIAAGAVTSAKIASGTITDANISASAAIARTKLDASTQTSLGKADSALQSAPVTSVASKTGAVTLVKSDVGLGNVDNTSDVNKPISTATQTALNAKVDSSSLATVATSGSYTDLTGKPTLATVATSGSYTDLSNLPHILLPASNGTDDTAAVNAAIAASSINSVIVGRPGTTYVAGSGPFQFLGTRIYWMYGVIMKMKDGANLDAVVASPAALTTGAGNSLDGPIQIYGLQVNGNVANQTSGQGNGVLLSSGANTTYGPTILREVHVRDARGTGICVSEVNSDGTALANGTAAPYSGEMHIENCRTYNSGANGIWQRGGATGITMTDGFCINNTVGYTTHDGIRIDSAGGWRIDGNHPYGTGLSGIITTGSYATKITNSYIEGIGVLDSAASHFSTSSAFSQAPTWNSGTTYSFNQVVIYSGVIYKSKVDSNVANQPDVSTTQWAAYNGGGSVGAIMAMSSQSARPLHIVNNQISLGHASWSLNANFLYRGILVQGPASGTSKVSAFIIGNDITNELQPAGTNTTAIRLAAQGAGPSGVHPFEQSNVIRGSWNSTRSADTTAAPVGSVGAGASGGTGASITVTGNNQVGNISVTSGNSGIVAGALASVSYTNSMGVAPRVVVEPRSSAAAALGPIYVTTSTTGFTINTSVAPANNTTYTFDYIATMGA